MQTPEGFLADSQVSMRCQEVTANGDHEPRVIDPSAAKQYACELYGSNGTRPVRTVIGSDDGPPELIEVLDTLAAEAAAAEEAGGFEAWAARMGYDPQSRRGERAYRAEVRRGKLLRQLLGDDRYAQLLWETERL
jgi:hypothetical protein